MISTHILDLQTGFPAAGVTVRLARREGETWKLLAEERSNLDGRISFSQTVAQGSHLLTFCVKEHLSQNAAEPFFSEILVTFEVTDPSRKLHVPLLLSPFGYSTYRGS